MASTIALLQQTETAVSPGLSHFNTIVTQQEFTHGYSDLAKEYLQLDNGRLAAVVFLNLKIDYVPI